ncbi:MAG: GNAT family N-acetyltransferase [Sulfitobacter sp.]
MNFPPFLASLENDTSVLIREVTQDDCDLLEIGFEHLSVRASYFRFLGAHKNLSEKELDKFTATNGPDHVAVGAVMICTADPEPIGIARYIRLPDQQRVAEIAITITDSYQHQGLGRLLLNVLAKFAQEGGITEFKALVHSQNTAMLGLLSHFDGIKTSLGGEETNVRFPVSPDPDQPAESSWLKNLKIKGPNQPASVWEDDGGAILKMFAGKQ